MTHGTFVKVHESRIDGRVRIIGSRFVDELKMVGDRLKKKYRLIVQNYADYGAKSIATKATTVQRSSQRVALSIAASMTNMGTYTRDITQAYIQSHTELERDVYIRALPELELPPDYVLEVVNPLRGINESGLHWYVTNMSHHRETLHMEKAQANPCVLIRKRGGT